jgi:hypothetical protein
MTPEEIQKVTELVQVLREEVTQLKKFLNPIEHCHGTTAKGTVCRNKCVPGTQFCRKHSKTVITEPIREECDDHDLAALRTMLNNERWSDQLDNDSLPELGEEFIR